jgi:pre-rRNA-processing protein TSR4
MAGYESDSSDGEFEETSVLLGYASREADEDTISRLGGHPVSLTAFCQVPSVLTNQQQEWLDPDAPPTAAFARCKVCKSMMTLLLQLNGELPEKFPNHERRLYIFACRKASCRRKAGSIRALRGVRAWKEEQSTKAPTKETEVIKDSVEPEKKEPAPALGDALFGGKTPLGGSSGANPFSSTSNPFSTGSAPANPFSSSSQTANPFASQPAKPTEAKKEADESLPKTFAQTLTLNTTPKEPPPPAEPWPPADALPQAYPTLYLADADFETLDPTPTKVPENARMEDADAAEPSALDREAFESSMDSTFQKFADRMSQNPDQVIRYEHGGTPLLYSKTDEVGEKLTKSTMPGCSNCGGQRTFEVQMTPHAITELEADDMSLDGMEWGTIIVGVCERDCLPASVEVGQAGYLEEWAGVQWEELSKGD